MPQSGANISAGAGDGDAYVLRFPQFDAAIANVYKMDADNVKNIKAEYDKLALQVNNSSGKIRPADMPDFKTGYDAFKTASLALQSPSVRNDPQQMALWKKKQDDAYFGVLSLSQRSDEASKAQMNIMSGINAHPELYQDSGTIAKINDLYNNSSVSQIKQYGLDLPTTWLHTPNTVDPKTTEKFIFGDLKTAPKREEVYDPVYKMVMGYNETQQQYYTNSPSKIASQTVIATNSFDQSQAAKLEYNNVAQNQPDQIKTYTEKAQAILNADAEKNKTEPYKIPAGFVGYQVAKNVINGQTQDVGGSKFVMDDRWQVKHDDIKTEEQRKFVRQNMAIEQQYRFDLRAATEKAKESLGLNFNSAELYNAALNPEKKTVFKGVSGENVTGTGYGLLNTRLSQLSARTDRNVDYVVIDRNSILNPETRRNIVTKIWGVKAAESGLYDLGGQYSPMSDDAKVQMFVNELRRQQTDEGKKGPSMDIKVSDLNHAIPIVIDRDKQITTVLNPALYDFDGFTSKMTQLFHKQKPAIIISGGVSSTIDDLSNLVLGRDIPGQKF